MKLTIAASVILFNLVTANSIWPRQRTPGEFGFIGLWAPGRFPGQNTAQEEQAFVDAGRNPNDTSSATFTFAPGNLSQAESSWTWRVNISEVTNADIEDTQVVNTQWELQWPGGGSLDSFVERAGLDIDTGGGLCLSLVELNLPSNITSRYSESDQGNCSMVLGDACAEALRKYAYRQPCENSPIRFGSFIDECKDVLLATRTASQGKGGTLIDSKFNETTLSGDTFWYHTSDPVYTANVSYAYAQAETRLNILYLKDIPGVGKGASAQAMVCQVVNPSARNAASAGIGGISVWLFLLVIISGLIVL